jgi:predicted RNA-binding Zn ribbon-like protein
MTTLERHLPHDLDLTIDFVNTLDIDQGTDALATPEGLTAWLADKRLLKPADSPLSEIDLQQAIRLREALRALMLANNGGATDERAASELERVARGGDLGVHFTAGGLVSLTPGVGGFEGALARLLVPVADAVRDESWQRAKACRATDCHWAFYDRSRNRSGVWCEMAVCGNRTKVRAYRDRVPHHTSPPGRS